MLRTRLAVSTVLATSLLLGGCASFLDSLGFWRGGSAEPRVTAAGAPGDAAYGQRSNVLDTVDTVKTAGEVTVISSHALRLPSHPLNSITAFDYAFPPSCGGHQFRVYESDGTQILEFDYQPGGGRRYVIRDYVSGPNPFISAGLWGAYDHTADSVSNMTLQYELRGSRLLRGTYSQGPVTGLELSAQRALGRAYDSALRDTSRCAVPPSAAANMR